MTKPTASHNRFDFLRLLFASVVFVYHMIVLAELRAEEAVWASLAELSIQGFFIISGALVYGSLERSKTLAQYGEKRARRLLPAYIVVILVPAAFALAMTGQFGAVGRYLGANLAFLNFLQPTLPEMFESHRIAAVNGALWTLKIEVMFYLILPILAWMLSRAGRMKWGLLAAIYLAAELWRYSFAAGIVPLPDGLQRYSVMVGRQLPGQMSFFVVGMALWLLWDRAKAAPLWTLIAGAALIAAPLIIPATDVLRAVGLGLMISFIAFAKGPKLDAARWGDLSYGVYITHFPIIQMLIALGVFSRSPALGIALSMALVTLASFALWHLIERRALLSSSHYRVSSHYRQRAE